LTGIEKIVFGRKYFISSWVKDGYEMVIEKRTITDEEMEEIGPVESFKLMRIISNAQMRNSASMTIKSTFQAELLSIAADENAYDRSNRSDSGNLYPIDY
jgi:hypothetical protein